MCFEVLRGVGRNYFVTLCNTVPSFWNKSLLVNLLNYI